MGWCSATEIFDAVGDKLLGRADVPDDVKYDVMLSLAEALTQGDWDCQQESGHWDHPAVKRVMIQIGWRDPDDEPDATPGPVGVQVAPCCEDDDFS